METGDKLTVLLLLALIAFAVLIVDERWLRAAIAVVPAMLIAQRAMHATATTDRAPVVGAADRRADTDVRGHIDELLVLFREFYTTCHLMTMEGMDPDVPKGKAQGIERKLNALLAEVTAQARARDAGP